MSIRSVLALLACGAVAAGCGRQSTSSRVSGGANGAAGSSTGAAATTSSTSSASGSSGASSGGASTGGTGSSSSSGSSAASTASTGATTAGSTGSTSTAGSSGSSTTTTAGSTSGTTASSTSSSSSTTGSSGTTGASCSAQGSSCATSADCCSGLACTNGTCQTCGLNSQACSGGCVVTRTDPNNCGGCGIVCGANQVCTGGACVASSACPQGLTACNGSCVDYQTSTANCGGCNQPCPAGQGCAAGTCVQTVPVADAGASACAAGGPPVIVGADGGVCAAAMAQVTFRWGVCSCGDFSSGDTVTIDGFNSTVGPGVDAGSVGSLGINGNFSSGNPFLIGGSMWVDSTLGMSFGSVGNRVGQELWVNGPLDNGGDLQVGQGAWVNGNLNGGGSTWIGGALTVPPGATVASSVVADGGVVRSAITMQPPCDCATNQLIDVAGIVADGQAHNDNASIGLYPGALDSSSSGYAGAQRLDLPCGRYYLTGIHAGSAITIAIHGRVALFVGGNIDMGSPLSITIDPQAELDLFIGGTISSGAPLSFGSTEVPAQTRVYVASSVPISLGGSTVMAGNLYLPRATFSNGSPLDIYGSLFAGSYTGGPLTVHYDYGVLSAGAECVAPDAGPPPCQSCRDCGNQACVNGACGACQTDADCCAPLRCQTGHCQAVLN